MIAGWGPRVWRSVVEGIPLPLSLHDAEGRVLFQNPAHREVFGEAGDARCHRLLWGSDGLCRWCPLCTGAPGGRLRSVPGLGLSRIEATMVCDDPPVVLEVVRAWSSRKAVLDTLHRAFDAADIAVFVEDMDGRIVDANAAVTRLFGRDRDDLLGRNVAEMLPEPTRRLLPGVTEALRRDGRFEVEAWQERADGTRFLARVAGVRHQDPSGDFVVVQVRDVTAERMEKEDLAERIRELEAFLYTVAHDLRAPLGTLKGYAALLAQALSEPEEGHPTTRLCRDLQGQAERLGRLLEDLLAFARIDQEDPGAGDLDIEAAARSAWADLGERVGESGGVLEVRRPLPVVRLAPVRLHQVLVNLFSNALRYRREDVPPRVVLGAVTGDEAGVPAGFVRVYVEDNGRGIPPSEVERIFDLFYRGPGSREGTGVGLAIVRRIVDTAGGRVWVESEPGRGSRFHLVLPGSGPSPGEGPGG